MGRWFPYPFRQDSCLFSRSVLSLLWLAVSCAHSERAGRTLILKADTALSREIPPFPIYWWLSRNRTCCREKILLPWKWISGDKISFECVRPVFSYAVLFKKEKFLVCRQILSNDYASRYCMKSIEGFQEIKAWECIARKYSLCEMTALYRSYYHGLWIPG